MFLGKLYIYMQKTETRSLPNILYYYLFRYINIRLEILKPVQERIRNALENISTDKNFLNSTPKAQQLKN
jgi:hypothetical protein